MKIRIEGCTAYQLENHRSTYLTVGKEYEAIEVSPGFITFEDDFGEPVEALMKESSHLPEGAEFVEVK